MKFVNPGGSLIIRGAFIAILFMSFFSGVTLVGCQLNTQEDVPAGAPLKLTGPTENCFSESLETVEVYFLGKAEPKEIDAVFRCVSGALEMFSTYGRGSIDRDSFTANELRSFLELNFLGTIKLNDIIMLEFMRLKQTLLGGGSDRLTKAEILLLTQILETLRIEAQRLRPYIDILNQREANSGEVVDVATLEQALSDFNFSMDVIGNLLGRSKQIYQFENFKTLLIEFQNLYADRSDWTGPEWFAKQMPLIQATKAMLIRPQGAEIAPDEWRLLFSDIGRIYGLYLRFNYAIRDRNMMYGETLAQIEIGVLQVVQVLSDAIVAKGSGRIEYNLLRGFFTALGKTEAFELPIQAATMNELLEPLLERILNPVVIDTEIGKKFDPEDRLSATGYRAVQAGLTTVNLGRLRDTILSWIEMQQLWERLEKDAVKANSTLAGQPIPIKTVRAIWASYSPNFSEAWTDIKSILDRPLPPATYPDGRLMILPTNATVIDRDSFAALNWKQQVVRTIGYGYVSDPTGLRMKGVTSKQFKQVFNDFWRVAIDLEFLDSTDTEIWKTGFTISNIFLSSSNGDDRLSFHEAVDLFVTSFAASEISKTLIRKDVLANCENLDPDPGGIPKIYSQCWRDRFKTGYRDFFSLMPGWIGLVKSFSATSWNLLLDDFEKASRKSYNPVGPLMSSEMDRVVSIHHYIEILYNRWDANRDGRLSMPEADKAYFLFKGVLRDASGFTNDEEVHALYAYVLTFGKPPESFGDKIYWLWWKKNPPEWEKRVKADRAMLATVFGNLAAAL